MTSGNMSKENDFYFDTSCMPCSDEGTDTKAVCKCMECQTYFCQACLKMHNKILKSHTLIGQKDSNFEDVHKSLLERSRGFKDTCDEHPCEVLKMYCRNHDLVCCTVCVAVHHRFCDGMQYIPSIAKGINESQEKVETLKCLVEVKGELQELLSNWKEKLPKLHGQKDVIIDQINKVTKRLMDRVEKIAKHTEKQVNDAHRVIENDTQSVIYAIETLLNSVENRFGKIKEFEAENEVQLFIQVKLGQKLAIESKQNFDKFKNKNDIALEYEFKLNIDSCLDEFESFGNLACDIYATEATLIGEFNITLDSERTDKVSVYGACVLETNEIILADNDNLKLKRLDADYKVIDSIDLGATPYGLCCTGHSEVAVSLPWLHKIQFISIGRKMVLKWSFKVDEICRGISYNDRNLYICCGGSGGEDPGHVVVYDMSGCLLCTFQTYHSPCPESVLHVDSKIYIVDKIKGVVVLDKEGHKLSILSDSRLSCTNDVCIGDHGELYVCGKDSHNVLQFGKHGKVINEILNQTFINSSPVTVTFIRNPARLLVTFEGSGYIKAFKLGNKVL